MDPVSLIFEFLKEQDVSCNLVRRGVHFNPYIEVPGAQITVNGTTVVWLSRKFYGSPPTHPQIGVGFDLHEPDSLERILEAVLEFATIAKPPCQRDLKLERATAAETQSHRASQRT